VTAVGARTAHAALVARQMGKPCVVGCGSMTVDVAADRAQLAGTTISGSDWVTIDGTSGNIYLGRRDTVETRPEAELAEIAGWRSQAAAHDGHKPKSSRHQARHGAAGA
jgi:pyruvate, orthophosphate dikinase